MLKHYLREMDITRIKIIGLKLLKAEIIKKDLSFGIFYLKYGYKKILCYLCL